MIIDSFGLSLTLAAFLPFSFFLAYGIMSIPAGMIIERFGGKIFNSDFGLFYQVTGGIPQSLYTTVSTFDTYVYNAIQSTAPIGQTAAASFFQAICSCGMILLANWVVSKLDNENRII